MKAILSTCHQVIKFPSPCGVQKILGDQSTARECYKTCLKPTVQHEPKDAPMIAVAGPEYLTKVNLAANDKEVLIGEDLQPHIAHLVELLITNLDAFA